MKRRALLKFALTAPFATRMASAAAGTSGDPRLLVLVYLHGGNDGYNTIVPYANPRYYALRPKIAVARDGIVQLSESHGFNPALKALLPMWQARELAIVQGIGFPNPHHQHYRDSEIMFTASGYDEFLTQGWLTRALDRKSPQSAQPADALMFGLPDIQEADPAGPLRGNKRAVVAIPQPTELLASRSLAGTRHELSGSAKQRKNELVLPPSVLRTSFGGDSFGQAARATVELAATYPSLAVVHITVNSEDGDRHHAFDTHWNQFDNHNAALKRLADGLAQLRAGLAEIGRWDSTLVVTYDEFGRAVRENDKQGTHHGDATTHFVLGGRVKGGWVGEAPEVRDFGEIGGPKPTIDTRRLLTTIVEDWWGLSASGMFNQRYRGLDLIKV